MCRLDTMNTTDALIVENKGSIQVPEITLKRNLATAEAVVSSRIYASHNIPIHPLNLSRCRINAR